MPQQPALTADEKLNDVWNEHLRAEFSARSADETVATMVANPRINQVPVMIGGDGKDQAVPGERGQHRLAKLTGPSQD
jgi:hypothetical protein